MPILIAGIGTAVPPHRIAQADAAELAQQYSCETTAQERLFRGMYRRAGVETRHSVVLERSDGDLGSRQSFYSSANPTTGDRMRKYEEQAGKLAVSAARDRSTTLGCCRTGSHTWSRSHAAVFARRASTSRSSSNWASLPMLLAPTLGSWAATGS